jgi:hypothetical protein
MSVRFNNGNLEVYIGYISWKKVFKSENKNAFLVRFK